MRLGVQITFTRSVRIIIWMCLKFTPHVHGHCTWKVALWVCLDYSMHGHGAFHRAHEVYNEHQVQMWVHLHCTLHLPLWVLLAFILHVKSKPVRANKVCTAHEVYTEHQGHMGVYLYCTVHLHCALKFALDNHSGLVSAPYRWEMVGKLKQGMFWMLWNCYREWGCVQKMSLCFGVCL